MGRDPGDQRRDMVGVEGEKDRRIHELEARVAGLESQCAEVARHKAELASERMRLLIESSPIAIGFGDSAGRIFDANEAFFRLTGYDREELRSLGLGWDQLTAPEYAHVDRQIMATLAATGTAGPYEKEYIRKDGTRVPLLLSVAKLAARDEHVAFILDISHRKRAEEELRRTAMQHRLALEAGNMGTWDYDFHGSIFWDARSRAIVGVGPDTEISFEQMIEWVHPEDQPAVRRAIGRALSRASDGAYHVEHRVIRADGSVRWVAAHGQAYFQGEGGSRRPVRFIGTLADITQRKEAEEALRESEQVLRDVINGSPDLLVFLKDVEGRFIAINSKLEKLLGITREQLRGKTDYDLFPREVADGYRANDRRVIESGAPAVLEEAADLADEHHTFLASKFPLRDRTGRIYGVGAISHDITGRKRIEDALRRSEAKWNAAIETFVEGAIIATEDEQVIYWNPAARALHGFGSATEGLGPLEETPNTFELWTPEGRHLLELDEWPMRRIKRGEKVRDLELRLRRPDQGWERIVSYSGAMVDTAGGERLIFLTVHDLTAQREAEQRLQAANARLLEADQRKNEFLAVLSHELRNPLAPITNSLYILDHAAPGGEQADRARQVIARQVAQLSNLVDDLLDVTRITRNKVQLHREPLELNEVVRRAVEDNHEAFESAEVHLELKPASRPIPVVADRTRIAQVVGNLLQNAAKFTVKGGRTLVSVAAEDSEAVVRVRDTGVGMSRETLGQLFQPFMQADQTLDRSRGGLGLGLALVKGIVELHGGRVSAHSGGIGQGAEFELRLPLDIDASLEPSESSAPSPSPRRRVLIIEDNVDAADSLSEALEICGHEVVVAYDGPQGLAKARAYRPDVVLCDIGLPGMDGFEVARAFRADEALRGIYLVALSGYALPEDLQRASEAGFERHLAKPPSLERLQQLLAELASKPAPRA